MTFKIVTDSLSDITGELIGELGVSVVPVYVRLGSLFPKERIYRSTVSPVIGTYVGPHVLSVSVLEAEKA